MWDTAGQEQYKSLTKNFYRNANGIIIVFDVTNRKSFDCIKEWIQNIRDYANKEIKVILVGNKNDLDRDVSDKEAISLATSLNINYFDCSAKDNTGFKDCVINLVTDISKLKNKQPELLLESKPKEESKCSC